LFQRKEWRERGGCKKQKNKNKKRYKKAENYNSLLNSVSGHVLAFFSQFLVEKRMERKKMKPMAGRCWKKKGHIRRDILVARNTIENRIPLKVGMADRRKHKVAKVTT